MRFVPHSLRHGGASCDYMAMGAVRLEDILHRGRWATIKSTRHYIQQGPALMAEALARIPEWQRTMGRLMGSNIRVWMPIPSDV